VLFQQRLPTIKRGEDLMKCPKCTGLLIQEKIQEYSGRFHGWRCIQCGLRLDQTIAQNRQGVQPEELSPDLDDSPHDRLTGLQRRTAGRLKRPAGKV